MTETYELFLKWWKTLPSGARRYLDPDNTNVGLAAFEAGHAAGRLEERADVLAEVDKTMREVWHEQAPPFNKRSDALERLAATMLERVRALAKDQER